MVFALVLSLSNRYFDFFRMKKSYLFPLLFLPVLISNAEEFSSVPGTSSAIVDTTFEIPWTTRVIMGAAGGDTTQNGFVQVLAPIWWEGETMVYVNPQMGLNGNTDAGFSLGMGVRRYVTGWDAIIGGNIFFDRQSSIYDNDFNQLGLGFEILTETVDFRFNYYLPQTGARAVSVATSTGATREFTEIGTPFATQNTVSQPITNISQAGNLNQVFDATEAAMEGYDLELGFLVPLLKEIGETRLYGGLYSFDNTLGNDFLGAKARAELRLSSKLTLETKYFEDAALYGDNWTFGFRVSLPIEDGPGGLRKMFSGILGDDKPKRSSSLAVSRNVPAAFTSNVFDRMGEQAFRNSFVQTSRSEFKEDPAKREFVVTNETREVEVNVLSDSVVFVGDPSAARGASTPEVAVGTYEDPVASIQAGVDLAAASFGNDGNVVVSAELSNYMENVADADSSVRLWGGGKGGFPGLGGKTLPYFGTPTVEGLISISDVEVFSVSGFNFVGGESGSGDALHIDEVADVKVLMNTFTVDADAIDLTMESGSFEISGNEFVSNGSNGLNLYFNNDTVVKGLIEDNLFVGSGFSAVRIGIKNVDRFALTLDVIGNRFVDNNFAFYLDASDMDFADQTVEINMMNNVFTDNNSAIEVYYSDMDSDGEFETVLDFNIVGNQFLGNNASDIYVDLGADGDGDGTIYDLSFNIRDNTFENTAEDALIIEIDDDWDGAYTLLKLDVDVVNNTFKNIGESAVDIVIDDNDMDGGFEFLLDIVGNEILTTGDTAIYIDVNDIDANSDTSNFVGVIANNEISDVTGSGVGVYIDGFIDLNSLIVGGNTISGVTGTGILIEGGNTMLDDGVFGNNLVSDAADDFDISAVDGTVLINGVERP
jgi:hypothetical protein